MAQEKKRRKEISKPCIFMFVQYRASMTIKTLYYPTDAQIYNS